MKIWIWVWMFFAGTAFGTTVSFPVEATTVGKDIVTLYTTLTAAPYKGTGSQVAINTKLNGLIPNVQGIVASTYSTILIISYFPPSSFQVQYVVVPVEQITEVIYSPTTIPSSGFSTGTTDLEIYVGLNHRAYDISEIINLLMTQSPYKTSRSKVNLQTTLTGPYYASFSNGLIQNIKEVTLIGNGTQMIVAYFYTAGVTAYVVVTPDEVTAINYIP